MFGINTTWGCVLAIAVSGAYTFSAHSALAQITPDGTLPNNSVININGKIFDITGGTQAGSNLFHSFQEFSVLRGNEAHFNNAVDIQNIISRVTGSSISNIDGLIKVLGNANLFFINPNGIIFGPNASLKIGGSFIASTASSINFADGTQFSAKPSQNPPLLTITAPLGLNMGSNPGNITVQGPGHQFNLETSESRSLDDSVPRLQVEPGKTLALVGGNVSLEGGLLQSPAGRIEIGSFGSNQVVNLVPVQQGWKLGYEGVPNFGNIQLSGKAFVTTTGDGGGAIAIAGKNISLTQESLLDADTLGNTNAEGISIVGESILVNQSKIRANTYSLGNGGQIQINANNITFENDGGVGTQATASGKVGDISLKAANSIVLRQSGIGSDNYSGGNAGQVTVEAHSLQVVDRSGFATQGNGGKIIITADELELRNNSGIGKGESVAPNSGEISITANSLQISDYSGLDSSTAKDSTGNAGDINIQVEGPLVLQNNSGINTNTSGAGNAGKINIYAKNFQIQNQAGLSSITNSTGNAGEINIRVADRMEINYAGIKPDSPGTGDAGKINIHANSFFSQASEISSTVSNTGKPGEINFNVAGALELRGTGVYTNTKGASNAGKIDINANSLLIENAQINSETKDNSTGNAGKITVTAESLKIINRENNPDLVGIFATSLTGKGGDIELNIGKLLLLRGKSSISTNAGISGQGGDGGNITINARNGFIVTVPNENSDISANAFQGSGGKIRIRSLGNFGIQQRSREDLVRELNTNGITDIKTENSPRNDITAFSLINPNLSGQVTINTPDFEPSKGLVELPVVLVDTFNLIETSCGTFAGKKGSEFTITGRGGLPPSPYEPLSTDVIWSDTRLAAIAAQQQHSEITTAKPPSKQPNSMPIVPATGWVFDGKGHVTLISHTSGGSSSGSTPAACPKQ